MKPPSLFDAGPPAAKSDAAPDGAGAGVRNPRVSSIESIRLPLAAPARSNAPAGTSKASARRIAGCAAQQRGDVYAVILRAGERGATDAEIELATGMRAQSVSPRRGELVKLRLVVDSGRRRPTPRGRAAAVWVIAEHAPELEGGAR